MSSVEQLLTVADVESRLRVSRATVYRLIAAGELASMHVGRARRVPASSVDAYIERHLAGDVA